MVQSEQHAAGRSLMNIENRLGPKTEPCGTPALIGSYTDFTPSVTVDCRRSERQDQNHWSEDGGATYDDSLERSRLHGLQC